ncbi:MAG: ABC transporter ATP-binding protein [Muribaculaceae bacterium]
MKPILETHNLNIGYRNGSSAVEVARDINIALYPGELVCLIGANGTGKSTLLRTLAASQRPLAGSVTIDGSDTLCLSRNRMSRLLAIVNTDSTQAGGLTVRELVALGRHPHTGWFGRLSKADAKAIDTAMQSVGITDKANRFIAELSDGERQKAMIAKALAQDTPIIFLDEPTAFLDIASKISTMQLLHILARRTGKAILLSSHDIAQVLTFADKLIAIDSSHSICCGPTDDMVLQGTMGSLFIGNNIDFDPATCNFVMESLLPHSARIDAPDDVRHILANALRRNDIRVEADDTCGTDFVVSVERTSPIDIVITADGNTVAHCPSVAQLIDAINDITNKKQ